MDHSESSMGLISKKCYILISSFMKALTDSSHVSSEKESEKLPNQRIRLICVLLVMVESSAMGRLVPLIQLLIVSKVDHID